MRRVLRVVGKILGVFILLVVLAIAVVYFLTERRMARQYRVSVPAFTVPNGDPAAIARGERLARVVSPCFDCHGEDHGGKVMVDDLAMGRLWAANLTRGRGGIGATYTDEDWARVLLHGVRPDRRSALFMPSHEFRFTASDLGDMVAYFRSLPPVDREVPAPRIGPMARALAYAGLPLFPAELVDHDRVTFLAPPQGTDALSRGRHLAATASCGGCHKADFTGGGGPPPGASNITPAAIGTWSETDFIRAIREHVRPDGSKIDDAMPRAYGQMTDDELRAIFTFLRSVPPRKG